MHGMPFLCYNLFLNVAFHMRISTDLQKPRKTFWLSPCFAYNVKCDVLEMKNAQSFDLRKKINVGETLAFSLVSLLICSSVCIKATVSLRD